MTLQEAREEFAARFYVWAKNEIRKEVTAGLPLLRRLETGCAFRFLSYIRALSDDEKTHLMTAYLRLQFPTAAERLGEPSSKEDAELVARFMNSPIMQSPAQLALLGRQLDGEKHLFADRKVLRAAIREELNPIFGQKITRYGSATWTYFTPISDWTVETDIDTGGRCQLAYYHVIGSPSHPFLHEHHISVMSWLGAGGQARWEDMTPEEVPEAVKSLSLYCSHFMAAVPSLLAGLQYDASGNSP